jgi:hypothetical protein
MCFEIVNGKSVNVMLHYYLPKAAGTGEMYNYDNHA